MRETHRIGLVYAAAGLLLLCAVPPMVSAKSTLLAVLGLLLAVGYIAVAGYRYLPLLVKWLAS